MTRQSMLTAGEQRAAFTLVELMLVLLIMAVFSAMVAPSVATALRSTGLKSTSSKMCELLNFAYMSAVSRHRPVVVSFDPEHRRCWVWVRTASLPWLNHQEKPKCHTLASLELPEGTELTLLRDEAGNLANPELQRRETIVFSSSGCTQDTIIELANQQGELFEIELVGVTGEVRLRQGERQ